MSASPQTLTLPQTTHPRHGQRLTLAEYFALPEGQPHYEYEDGELVQMNPPHGRHQQVLLHLASELLLHIRREKVGRLWPEIEVHLPQEQRVYIPDLVYLATEHLNRYSVEEGRIHGTPDLVVEILLPSTERRDRTTKMRAYQQSGLTWYWLVDPDELICQEYKWTPEGYLLAQSIPPGEAFTPHLFPGLSLDLAALLDEAVKPEE